MAMKCASCGKDMTNESWRNKIQIRQAGIVQIRVFCGDCTTDGVPTKIMAKVLKDFEKEKARMEKTK